MSDLSRLSDAERRALRMLARGHTAKSAALELGVSEGAVNERLHEARRKTGVASSRQLARLATDGGADCGAGDAADDGTAASANRAPAEVLLGAPPPSPQETRDEKIGMAGRRPAGQDGRRNLDARAAWRLFAGTSAMIVLAASIGAFAALAVADHKEPRPPAPPRVVAVSPAPGAIVPAGPLALSVTFDQPMQAEWSFVTRDPATFPTCAPKPVQSKDRRSLTLSCTMQAGRSDEVGFDNDRHRKFASEAGIPAVPAVVRFSAR
jgi:DNA-binding CsgD family transcriptional regulator